MNIKLSCFYFKYTKLNTIQKAACKNQVGGWLKMRADPQHQQDSWCCKNIWFGKIVTRGAAGGKQTVAEAGILDVGNGAQVG